MGVDNSWLTTNIMSPNFKLYSNIKKYFTNMAENKAKNHEINFESYKNNLGLDARIDKAKKFISDNNDILNNIESKNGIDLNLIVAIIGLETNFGEEGQKGKFFIFNALLSQYIFMEERKNYALIELFNLYKFSKKIEKPTDYFVGSFAGACGLSQFIPSSLVNYFIDSYGNDKNIDIYAIDDSLFSIENYLNNNGLSGALMNNREALYKAIYSYNRSDVYTQAILYIYDSLKETQILNK